MHGWNSFVPSIAAAWSSLSLKPLPPNMTLEEKIEPMDILPDPYSKTELIDALKQVNQKVTDSFGSIPAERFFQANAENWSPAENLVHLIKSVSPVGKAMKLPEMLS